MAKQSHDEKLNPDADATGAVAEVAAKAPKTTVATFAALKRKPRRTIEFPVATQDEDGKEHQLLIKYQALSATEYDELVEKHPPTPKEKSLGAVYNIKTFAPALISAVSLVPRMSVEEATEIYNSEDWSGGEVASLFIYAQRVCNAGIDIPFNDRG